MSLEVWDGDRDGTRVVDALIWSHDNTKEGLIFLKIVSYNKLGSIVS